MLATLSLWQDTLFCLIREHEQKTFVMLNRFWPFKGGGEGGGGVNKSIKKEKFMTIFFWDVKWSCKKFWKMISADVNAQVKQ